MADLQRVPLDDQAMLRAIFAEMATPLSMIVDSHDGANQIQDPHWDKGASDEWGNLIPTICVNVSLRRSKPVIPVRKLLSCTTTGFDSVRMTWSSISGSAGLAASGLPPPPGIPTAAIFQRSCRRTPIESRGAGGDRSLRSWWRRSSQTSLVHSFVRLPSVSWSILPPQSAPGRRTSSEGQEPYE